MKQPCVVRCTYANQSMYVSWHEETQECYAYKLSKDVAELIPFDEALKVVDYINNQKDFEVVELLPLAGAGV